MKDKKFLILALILSLLYLLWGIESVNALRFILGKRILRVLAVWCVAYTTSVSTTYFQSITHNSLLTPSILGIDTFYLLIQMILTIGLSWIFPSDVVFVLIIVIMCILASLLYSSILKVLKHDLLKLLLIGMVMNSALQSIITAIGVVLDPNDYAVFQSYTIASLNDVNTSRLFIALVGIGLLTFLKRPLDTSIDVIGLGKDWAQNFGEDVAVFEKKALVLVIAMTSIATALIGPNLFLGLIAINIAKQLIKTHDSRGVMALSTYLSVILLIGSQIVLERVLNFNGSLGFGLSLIGGIIFMHSFWKEMRL